MRFVQLSNGDRLPALGLGTWRLGESRTRRAAEVSNVRRALEIGYRLIDTAEMYGDGGSEEVVGEAVRSAIAGGVVQRAEITIVTKVLPSNASRRGVVAACERSLKRLGVDQIDLYLLHWRGSHALVETIAGFETLLERNAIRAWGVSNFDVDDLAELAVAGGIDADKIIDNLKMVFMGSLEASNGKWGVFTDIVYVDIGNDKSNSRDFSLGRVGLPANTSANVDYDLKGWMWTLAGTYRMISDKDLKIDLLAGTRVLDIRQKLRWDLVGNIGQVPVVDNAGTREVDDQNWDFIVGFKGRAAMGDGGWFVPYYLDVGTGNSRFTWQAMVGVGYTFGWGDITGAWRYIDYQMKSGNATEEMNFNGPAIAATFRW